jgi:hypothetical protein
VTVACPDGLAATLGVATAHVRPVAEGAPSRVALEFEHPREPIRTLSSMQRLADGLYAPRRRADAPQLVRAMLGADPTAAERRSTERIRVPLEDQIQMCFFRGGELLGEAVLADVAPLGFGCIAPDGFVLPTPVDEVRRKVGGRELLRRRVRELETLPVVVRGETRTRVRVVIEPGQGPSTWALPAWVGAHEFGAVRLDASNAAEIVQAALLARSELIVEEARTTREIEEARELAPRATWLDGFDDGSIILTARAGDALAGTIRLVPDAGQGLPFQRYCPKEYWPQQSGRWAEASRLAVSHSYRGDINARLGVAVLLTTAGYQRCVAEGFSHVVMYARVVQERFYRALGFQTVSPPFADGRWGLVCRIFLLDVGQPGALLKAARESLK